MGLKSEIYTLLNKTVSVQCFLGAELEPDMEAQTVLLHSGITRWLNCKCIVMATRPLIPEAVREDRGEGEGEPVGDL